MAVAFLSNLFSTINRKNMIKMYVLTPEFAFEVAENDEPEVMTWMEAKLWFIIRSRLASAN